MAVFLAKMVRMKTSDMKKLCPKCKTGHLKPTSDPAKLLCPFCGRMQLCHRELQQKWTRTI
jgi:hypothetical protein